MIDTKTGILFDADISSSTYNWTPTAAQCGVDDDYIFRGWYSDSGLTTPYSFNKMPAANVVLYAKWDAPAYTVNFHLNYDNATPEPYLTKSVEKYKTVDSDLTPEELAGLNNPTPAKEHYSFTNWYTAAEGGEIFDPAGKAVTGDMDVYAHWKPNGVSYTVHYLRADDHSVHVLPDKTVTGSLVVGQEITEVAPYITGYTLDGESGVTMVADQGSITITLDYEGNEITFYYGKKPDTIRYSVYYLLWGEAYGKPVEDQISDANASWRVAEPKLNVEVVGSYTSVTETAKAPMAAFSDYSPTRTTDTLALGTNEDKNILIFYYTKGAKLTVEYLDMEGDSIQTGHEDYLDAGETYVLSTAVNNYTQDHIELNGETTTETTFTAVNNTDPISIRVYYRKNLILLAHSANKPYDGTELKLANSPDNITADGLKDGHTITAVAFTADSTQTVVGIGDNKIAQDSLAISGLKNGVTADRFYDITCLDGTLTVTKINVIISVEPDRWTGNVYDGTYKATGFTNGGKKIEDYIIISSDQFKTAYLETLWTNLMTRLKGNGRGYADVPNALVDMTTGQKTVTGLQIINKRDAGDYYEESSYFLAAATEALADLADSADDAYKNYNPILYVRECRLEIAAAPLTITTGDAEKSYDSTPLTRDEVTVTARGETITPSGNAYTTAEGDTITINVTGSQLTPGESQNIYEIDWGTVKAENYSITETLGTLKVTKRAITITASDLAKAWNADDPDFAVTVSYEADDGQGGTTTMEIPAILTHWAGNSYTLQLNDPDNGFRENISLTITREEGEEPGVYVITPASDNQNFDINFEKGRLVIAIARVSNDKGESWTYHTYLTNSDYDAASQDPCMQGAFDYANTLTGDVIIETLCQNAKISDSDDRYEMASGFTFGGSASSVTLRTTQSADFNSTGFKSIITRGFSGGSLLAAGVPLTLDNIVFDGQKGSYTGCIIEMDADSGSVTVGADAVLKNAESGDGGAVHMSGGTLTMKGTIRGCKSNGSGGAVYMGGGTLTMEGTIRNCESAGSGGAVYMGGGMLTMNKGTIRDCTSSGAGGAVYVGAGGMTMSGGTITGNSSKGGAIDVGESVRLYFSGKAVVYDNLSGDDQKNVVLSVDDNTIINAKDLDSGAKIGVYVPDDIISGGSEATLFEKHGGVMDQFGTYTGSETNLSRFVNDRNGFRGKADEDNSVIWSQTIRIEVRYIDPADEDLTTMPTRYTVMYRSSSYDPPQDPSAIDKIFEDIYSRYSSTWVNTSEEMIPWLAFLNNRGTDIDKNVLSVLSSADTNGRWAYKINNISSLTQAEDQTLILYYTEPAYDLKIRKTVEEDTGIEKTFDVTISSTSITRDRYIVLDDDGTGSTVSATPARGSVPGRLTVKVEAGSEITVKNLVVGDYTIAEPTRDYTVTAQTGADGDTDLTALTVSEDNRHEMQVTMDADRVLEITNTRRKVDVTVQKTVLADDTSGEFSITATVTDGKTAAGENQPVKNFTLYEDADDSSKDLKTDDDGKVTFTLAHDGSQVLSVPSGADVKIREKLTEEQKEGYAVFMAIPGESSHIVSGASGTSRLDDVHETKTLRVFNIPSICKVTDGSGSLLYFLDDNGTEDDSSDDIYIPGIYGTIHGAFDDINEGLLYRKTGTSYSKYSGSYQVQMLVDYEVPNSDVVVVNPGFDITFTTAKVNARDGYPFRRTGEYSGAAALGVDGADSIGRAVLRRENGSTEAFFTVSSEDTTQTTAFTMSELIIDGRGASLNNNVRGGCLTAYKSDAAINHCAIYDFEAKQGGAVYTTGSSLAVTDSVFDTCKSNLGGNQKGGGAINTTANTLTVKDSRFLNCSAIWQGGAVYQYGQNKEMTIMDCDFIDCTSRSGGAVQADVTTVSVSDCTFTRCTAVGTGNGGNGGGLNNYFGTQGADIRDTGSRLTVTNCTFKGCSSSGNGELLGGGLRSKALTVSLTGCAFLDDNSNPANPVRNAAKLGGGAVFDNANSTVTLSLCTFANCAAAQNGGGIYTAAKELKIDGTDSISGCSAENGGAVCVDMGKLTLSGGAFNGNTAKTAGAAIYLTDNTKTKLDISGAPSFGDGTTANNPANTVTMSGFAGKENGGDDTAYTGDAVRQDIYLSEANENAPAAITVTGDMTGEEASVWVWAASEYHYKQLTPFAILTAGVNGDTLKAFRNARPDDETENATDTYLFGTAEGDKTGYVYWTGIGGSRKVILRKTDSAYASVSGKSFTIYKGTSGTAYTPKGGTNPLSGLTSGGSGCLWIGDLPYGWYIIEEADPHVYFFLVVTENGTYGTLMEGDDGSLANKVGGFDTRESAETAAKALYEAKK